MSRWRVSTGRSVGSSGPPPSWWMTSRLPMTPDEGLEVRAVAGPPAAVEVGHERRPADRRRRRGVGRRTTTSRSGLRAWSSNVATARCATSSSTWAGSRRTRRRLRGRPSRRRRRTGRAPGRRGPGRRCPRGSGARRGGWPRRGPRDRISSGGNGLTMRRHGSCGIPRRGASRTAAVRLGRRGIGADGVAVDRVHRRRCYRPPAAGPGPVPPAARRSSAGTDRNLRAISETGRGMVTTVAVFQRPSLRESWKGTA